ncbi:MAG: hypothetical protein ACQSGP_02220 [Frankia sp.]
MTDDPLARLLPKAGPGRSPSEQRVADAVTALRGRRRARTVRVGGSLAVLGVALGVAVAVPRLSADPPPPPPMTITAAAPPAAGVVPSPTTAPPCPVPASEAGGSAAAVPGPASAPPLRTPAAFPSAADSRAAAVKAGIAEREREAMALRRTGTPPTATTTGPTTVPVPTRTGVPTPTGAPTPTGSVPPTCAVTPTAMPSR